MSDKSDDMWGKVLKEAGFALDDIRQKVVEEPWFKEAQTPNDNWYVQGLDHAASDKDIDADDLYGRDAQQPERDEWHVEGLDPDAKADVEQDRNRDALGEKGKAQELYGQDRERDLER